MLNMVLHTLSIHLIVLSEGSTQSGQVFVLMLYFWNYNYHFRHIVEMYWLSCMGHKCLRSDFFKIDEDLACCDIPAEKLTLG
jgi:hypothetical protein